MLSGDFARKLRKLNRNLRIYCLDDDSKPAGLFHVQKNEYTPICSVDKNFIPRHAIATENNRIVKSGWQRTLRILLNLGLVSKEQVLKEFGPMDRKKVTVYKTTDKIDRIEDLANKKHYYGHVDPNGQPIFSRNEILDMKEELSRRK